MGHRVRVALDVRKLGDDSAVALFERSERIGIGIRRILPRASVVAASAIGATVRHRLLNGRANAMQIIGQVARLQRGSNSAHAATDVNAHSRGHNGSPGWHDGAHGGAQAPVHIRHGGNPLINEGQARRVDELGARFVFEFDAVNPRLDRRGIFGGDEFVVHVLSL